MGVWSRISRKGKPAAEDGNPQTAIVRQKAEKMKRNLVRFGVWGVVST